MAQTAQRKRRPGRPREDERGEESIREQLLAAAGELFGTLGYPGASVNQIVKQVGITPAALYWHFESKEALLYALLMEGTDQFEAELNAAVGDADDPAEVLRRLAAGHTHACLTNPQVARVDFSAKALSQWLSKEHYEEFHERQRKIIARWRDVIRMGMEAGEFAVDGPTITALAIIDMCEGAPAWFNPTGPLSAEEVADEYGLLALRLAAYEPKKKDG